MNDYKLQYLRLEICDDIKSPIRSKNGTNICYNLILTVISRQDESITKEKILNKWILQFGTPKK